MRRIVLISALAILLAATMAAPIPADTTTDETLLSPELRAALKVPLSARIKELREEKNEIGAKYIYGSSYSKYTPVDDGYEATFIKRISGADEVHKPSHCPVGWRPPGHHIRVGRVDLHR